MITPVKLIRKIREKKAFTLVEVIIAATIFTTVTVMGTVLFVNVIRIQKKIALENAIYEDARFAMENIAREIRQNTIDYEEYYRKDYDAFAQILGSPRATYGQNYGCYAQRFYLKGSDNDWGARCNNGTPATADCVILRTTQDINTGQNPFAEQSADSTTANALCDKGKHGDSSGCTSNDLFRQNQLYLIDAKGEKKTFFALQTVNDLGEKALSTVKLKGVDSDNDGIIDQWTDPTTKTYRCSTEDGFDCSTLTTDLTTGTPTLETTLIDKSLIYKGFVPITPLRSNIYSLTFYIAPLEDPRKAFAENLPSSGIQQQPHVTVVMKVRPSASEASNFGGTLPEITLQTTITSRVYNEVSAFVAKDLNCPEDT